MGALKVRVNGVWEDVGGVASEVTVGPDDPYLLDPAATDELWFDTTTQQLWYRSNDPSPHWRPTIEIPADEVFVGLDEPTPDVELWYDPAAVATIGPGEIPKGGLTHQALTKRTDQDGEVEWSGPHLKLAGGTVTGPLITDDTVTNNGVVTNNSVVTNNEILDQRGQLNMGAGDKIQFPNETGPKIYTYGQTFGIGVESGETSIFASSKVGFHANASNGALWAEITSAGLGPRTNTNVSWQNGFTGTAQFRVNPAMVTLALWNFTNGVELFSFNPVKMFDYPAGVPAPWANCSGAVMPVWMGSTYGYLPLRVDCRTDGVFIYAADYFEPGDLWECACTVTWAR